MRLTAYQLRGWLLLVTHSPVSVLWLLQVIVLVVGVVHGFSHPAKFLVAFGTFGTLNGITRLLARHKGVSAAPPSPWELPPAPSPTLPGQPERRERLR